MFLCGNGGSAANAIHLANDLLYGILKQPGSGLRVHALPANTSVISCLANDEGYEYIFALQLAVQARQGDILIAPSGSGDSANIVRALEEARRLGMRSYAIITIHFPVDDMQIAEDLQLVVGHMVMKWLYAHRREVRVV